MHKKNVSDYLNQPEGIGSLMQQAGRLLELRQVLSEFLPPIFLGSCSIANYRQGKVVIFAENSAIGAKLKLLGPALNEHFMDRGLQVTGVVIEVQPRESSPPHQEKVALLSVRGARALAELAAQLPESELKSSISALAGRVRKE